MARIRSVKPELHSSISLATCSVEARYVFIGLFSIADDSGRLLDHPKTIAGVLFPHDEHVGVPEIRKWLDELEGVGCVRRYTGDGKRCIVLPGWAKHQRINKPSESRLPEPPANPPEEKAQPEARPATPAESPGEPAKPRGGSRKLEVEVDLPALPEDAEIPEAIHRQGLKLAKLAFEQPVKPVLRSQGDAFAAVLKILERLLGAGISVRDVEAAVKAGVEVWTLAGVQTAIAQAKPTNGRRPDVSRTTVAAEDSAYLKGLTRR